MAITRTNFTRQYEHVGVIAHGAHPEYRLEFEAEVDASDATAIANAKKIFQGSVVSLNDSGKYILGCSAGTANSFNYPVPCISMKNVADPDVSTGIVGTDYRTSVYSAIGGVITAIPCTGGYEIETTEFVAQGGTTTFKPGDALVPATSDSDKGKVKIATAQPFQAGDGTTHAAVSEPIVGFVSKAEYTASNYGHTRLSFFTNFIPAAH